MRESLDGANKIEEIESKDEDKDEFFKMVLGQVKPGEVFTNNKG